MMAKKQVSSESSAERRGIPMIRVTVGYRGASTGEQYIQPGIYLINDPVLHMQGDFLVASGRAEVLPTMAEVEDETDVTPVTVDNSVQPTEGAQA
jgi:hypothetical protein